MNTPIARYIWSIVALFVVEATALALVIRVDGALPPITALSLTAALLCLLVGLWPLLLRPSKTTQLSAYLSIVLAGFTLIPTRPSLFTPPPEGLLLWLLPAFMLYRLVHGVLLATAGFHVAAHFPPQAPTPACPRPTPRAIGFSYLGSALMLTAFVTVPVATLRPWLFALLIAWIFLLIGLAVRRLACLSRTPMPEQPQIAQQARILLSSALLAALPTLLLNVSEMVIGSALARADLVALFLVIFPVGAAYTILRHDLLTLDSAIRRTLAYTVLSALALLLYFAVTLILTVGVVRRWPEFARIVVVLSVLATAFAFAPLQQRVQSLVDRWLYPERRNFYAAMGAARKTLGAVVERKAVIALLTQELPRQIDAQWATLTLPPAPATPGQQATAPAWDGTLIVGDQVVGRYWLGPRRTLPVYETDEQAALQQLLNEAALVLAYADTIGALQQLNQELEQRVAMRTEQLLAQQRALAVYAERQQLARNLHDSITQSLFSLTLGLRALRKVGQRDPQTALAQLAEQEIVAQQALTEMRELLVQLRSSEPAPGEATMIDLVDRLHQLCAEQKRHGTLQVTLQTPEQFFCTAPLALELLAIVREALHNVVKHSSVDEAVCTLSVEEQGIALAVVDHGHGFNLTTSLGKSTNSGTIEGITATAGHYGLRGMQERAAAIGGQFEVHSSPGSGTAVSLHLSWEQYNSGFRK